MHGLRNIADLHLVAPEAARRAPRTHRPRTGRCRSLVGNIRRSIGRQRPAETARRAKAGWPEAFAEDVPEGDVHAGQGGQHDTLAAVIIGRLVDFLPQVHSGRRGSSPMNRGAISSRGAIVTAKGPPHIAASPQPHMSGSSVCTFTSNASRVWYVAARIGDRVGHLIEKRERLDPGYAHALSSPVSSSAHSTALGYFL